MSKFASVSVLLLAIALIVLGALIPEIAILGFLGGAASIISIVGSVLLVLYFVGLLGWKGILLFLLYFLVRFGVGFVAGLIGLNLLIGGLVFDLIMIALSFAITVWIANRI